MARQRERDSHGPAPLDGPELVDARRRTDGVHGRVRRPPVRRARAGAAPPVLLVPLPGPDRQQASGAPPVKRHSEAAAAGPLRAPRGSDLLRRFSTGPTRQSPLSRALPRRTTIESAREPRKTFVLVYCIY